MRYIYQTENVCPRKIIFDINKNIITNVEFIGGGCPGNLQALSKLVNNMTVEEIEEKIGGIICGNKKTSCADQLSKAVKEAYEKSKQNI